MQQCQNVCYLCSFTRFSISSELELGKVAIELVINVYIYNVKNLD